MGKLTQEQIDVVRPLVQDLAAGMPDVKIAAAIKEKVNVDVSPQQVTHLRAKMGIRKTRGRNSKIVNIVTPDVVSEERLPF